MLETVQSVRWLPLTPAQFDFWEEFSFHPHQPVSTVAHRITLRGELDEPALLAALEQVVAETDVFTIQFQLPDHDDLPLQRCNPQLRPRVRLIELQQTDVAESMMQADIERQLNLLSQPLAVVWLLRFSPTHYTVYIRAHHIIIDGFGMALIEHRLAELYRARLQKTTASQPFHAFYDFLAEEQHYASSEKSRQDAEYWRRYVTDAPPLPVLQKGGEDYGAECLHSEAVLPEHFSQQLSAFSERCGTGWPDLLLALSAAWLTFQLYGENKAEVQPIWVPVMNRRGMVAASVPALAVNILPLFVHIEPQEKVVDYVKRTAKTLRDLRAHGRYRIETLAADQGLGKGTRYFFSPLINVLPFDPPLFAGCEAEREVMASGPGDGFNITWRGRTDASELHIDIDADPAMYASLNVEEMFTHLHSFLSRAMMPEAGQQPVYQLLNQ
ncbi:hypothetical protein AV650_08925 [Serratia fonticola]|nr:hypothetical protein AV650_08925 [Serratia fonticola]